MTGLMVNVGCGSFLAPKPWINVDRNRDEQAPDAGIDPDGEPLQRRPDVHAVSWDMPFESGSCARIYVGHLVEHLVMPDQVAQTCAEIRRIAAPGAEIMLLGPDMVRTAEMVFEGSRDWRYFWSGHGRAGRGTPFQVAYEGNPGDVHQWSCSQEAIHFLALWQFPGCEIVPLKVEEIPEDWPLTARNPEQSAVLIRCP